MTNLFVTINFNSRSTANQLSEVKKCIQDCGVEGITVFAYRFIETDNVEIGCLVEEGHAPFNATSIRALNGCPDSLLDCQHSIDSSATPGIGKWRNTGHTPYYPFVSDGSVPGNPRLAVLEIPQTTTFIGHERRILDLFTKPELLHPAFEQICHRIPTIVVSVSSDKLNQPEDDILKPDLECLSNNITHIMKTCESLQFNRMSELHK